MSNCQVPNYYFCINFVAICILKNAQVLAKAIFQIISGLKIWVLECWKPSQNSSLESALMYNVKVRIFWEGHKIWKNYWEASNFKWIIFSNFVAFSEYLNFKLRFCEKNTKNLRNHHFRFVHLCKNGQIYCGDFAKGSDHLGHS